MDKIGEKILLDLKTFYKSKPVKVLVEIIDYKRAYGKNRYLVRPVSGKGEIWVELNAKHFK